jgi:hypothetical protein
VTTTLRLGARLFVLTLTLTATLTSVVLAAAVPSNATMPTAREVRPLLNTTTRGIFVAQCRFSHSATDDPIVHPGMAGMSHLHHFFGNTSTNATSTTQSLLGSSTKCRERNDKSAYWVPALMVDGQPVSAVRSSVYYRGVKKRSVRALPNGFKLVTPRGDATTFWTCKLDGVNTKRSVGASDVPTCTGNERLSAHVRFQSCWNGALDSADHISHAVYPNANRKCPKTHPIRIPELQLNVFYPLSIRGGSGLTLASGGAASMHADVFTAWTNGRQRVLVKKCLNQHRRCGPAQFV